jgi:G3E family GTPase
MDRTDVYLISGFLGAGKTTFLNRLVKQVPPSLNFLVLMNEFGEMGLDGTLVEGQDVDMIEISKGSIFCACVKTDFIKALHELATKVRPDVMLIETTGVANPRDLDRDLKLPIFSGRFDLKDKFCLIDGANFLDTYESFLAIEKQLESSDVFVINKMDLTPREHVPRIKEIVQQFNPGARFLESTFAEVKFDGLFREGALAETVSSGSEVLMLTEEELEAYVERLLEDEAAEVTPPDRLLSTVVELEPGTRKKFEEWLEGLPKLVRGKGIVEVDGEIRLFNLVNGGWSLDAYTGQAPKEEMLNRVVFISLPEHVKTLKEGH